MTAVATSEAFRPSHASAPPHYKKAIPSLKRLAMAASAEEATKHDLVLCWTDNFDKETEINLQTVPGWQLGTVLEQEQDYSFVTLGRDDNPFHKGDLVRLHRTRVFSFCNDPTAQEAETQPRYVETFFASIGGLRGGARNDYEVFMAWKVTGPYTTQYEFTSLVTFAAIPNSPRMVVLAVIVNKHVTYGPTVLLCREDSLPEESSLARGKPVRARVPFEIR